jgi:uncharacterized protein with NRDE domain
MCTVSFVRANDTVIITSNRDEHIQRENAAAPDFYILPNKKIIFPKDARAGGTWFAASNTGEIAVLLNGAFKKHKAQPPYRKSRGLILLEIIEADEPISYFDELNLENIEPFTLIIYQPDSLHELRWDGSDKYNSLLDITGSYIWSSATLYTDDVIRHRQHLFEQFIGVTANITVEKILDFHMHDQGDTENGFVIDRQTGMKTFSITQAVVNDDTITFLHNDLLQQNLFNETMVVHRVVIKN